jgi:hypothetical protein
MEVTTLKPTHVERAQSRLDQAVNRLEAALNAKAPSKDSKLAEELAATRSRNTALQEVNETVSSRLNDAISRLKSMLDE